MNFKISAVVIAAAIVIGSPALAWKGQVVKCYDGVLVPAKYDYVKTLHSPARTAWEHRKGQLVEMYYPAVYIEKKVLVTKQHWVKRQAKCKH